MVILENKCSCSCNKEAIDKIQSNNEPFRRAFVTKLWNCDPLPCSWEWDYTIYLILGIMTVGFNAAAPDHPVECLVQHYWSIWGCWALLICLPYLLGTAVGENPFFLLCRAKLKALRIIRPNKAYTDIQILLTILFKTDFTYNVPQDLEPITMNENSKSNLNKV